MERALKRSEDLKLNDIFDFIFQNAMGNVIVLPKSPSKSEMKGNTIGYYNNEIFFKLANGELKKISVTDVT
jgi:hypothetical protein